MIDPLQTREELIEALMLASGIDVSRPFSTGVLQT